MWRLHVTLQITPCLFSHANESKDNGGSLKISALWGELHVGAGQRFMTRVVDTWNAETLQSLLQQPPLGFNADDVSLTLPSSLLADTRSCGRAM